MERGILMKTSMARRVLILIILYIIALVSSIYVTFAYYKKESSHDINLTIGDAQILTEISFNGVLIDELSPYYDSSRHVLLVNVSDETSENALSKLDINLSITSDYASRVRIKWMESYIKERFYHERNETIREAMAITTSREGYHPFSLVMRGQDYQVITHEDGYQYVDMILEERTTLNLLIADGGLMMYARSNDQFIESIILEISLVVEIVQANRYQEVWQLSYQPFSQ
jgi:hypothetical protein